MMYILSESINIFCRQFGRHLEELVAIYQTSYWCVEPIIPWITWVLEEIIEDSFDSQFCFRRLSYDWKTEVIFTLTQFKTIDSRVFIGFLNRFLQKWEILLNWDFISGMSGVDYFESNDTVSQITGLELQIRDLMLFLESRLSRVLHLKINFQTRLSFFHVIHSFVTDSIGIQIAFGNAFCFPFCIPNTTPFFARLLIDTEINYSLNERSKTISSKL